uniref:SRCR domain-containing protein n=1 Tax=Sparus aurata TaxID=8175 RepID=A0A671TTP2_SPAAU
SHFFIRQIQATLDQVAVIKAKCLVLYSIRLVNGNSLCSGRLEVKSNQRWSSVCEDDFDQQDAEVVCRELGCGAPSVLQGALYGEVEAPMWTKEFQCGGHESALLDCRTSGSDRNTCSPGKFLLNVTSFVTPSFTLVWSEPDIVRLVAGSSRCAGELEVKQHGVWRKVDQEKSQWNLKTADATCRQLDCGSAVSTGPIQSLTYVPVWRINSTCLHDCVSTTKDTNNFHLEVKYSIRLVNGNSLCSGRLEVKSNQRWSSVCEDDFDQQDAEVVCRELGCGAPSVLQGALYGEVEAPMWTKEFQLSEWHRAKISYQKDVAVPSSKLNAAGVLDGMVSTTHRGGFRSLATTSLFSHAANVSGPICLGPRLQRAEPGKKATLVLYSLWSNCLQSSSDAVL